MAARIRKSRNESTQPESIEAETATPTRTGDSSITDELLDEIDAVLEANAEDFVRQYIQKGGE